MPKRRRRVRRGGRRKKTLKSQVAKIKKDMELYRPELKVETLNLFQLIIFMQHMLEITLSALISPQV